MLTICFVPRFRIKKLAIEMLALNFNQCHLCWILNRDHIFLVLNERVGFDVTKSCNLQTKEKLFWNIFVSAVQGRARYDELIRKFQKHFTMWLTVDYRFSRLNVDWALRNALSLKCVNKINNFSALFQAISNKQNCCTNNNNNNNCIKICDKKEEKEVLMEEQDENYHKFRQLLDYDDVRRSSALSVNDRGLIDGFLC